MTYVTGFHAMEGLIRAGTVKGATLLVSAPGPRVKRMMDEARASGLNVKSIQGGELDKLAPDHRGAALAMEGDSSLIERSFNETIASISSDRALVVILDHIEDPHNLGAILRSADIFAADLVVIPERRSAKETDSVGRASAGAVSYVPLSVVPNLPRALETLKDAGFWTYVADMDGTPVASAKLSGRIALVLGAEGKGVSRLVRERCDLTLCIPQHGHVDSLNVSVAAGILLYEARKQLGPPNQEK